MIVFGYCCYGLGARLPEAKNLRIRWVLAGIERVGKIDIAKAANII
jgi:hypothetical protein